MRQSFTSLSAVVATAALGLIAIAGCSSGDSNNNAVGLPSGSASMDQVTRGRAIIVEAGCIDCHNRGTNNPSDPNWMAGYISSATINPADQGTFQIGPFKTNANNLTPDATNGIGRYSERQIFNALRFGLKPASTPDGVITSTTPGQGNFPAAPHYLAPPMPWTSTRHFTDDDTWAVVAYLKHGIKANSNLVADSQAPPDFWASTYVPAAVGPYPLPSYPASSEQFQP